MERFKGGLLGRMTCTLSPEEVIFANNNPVLNQKLDLWEMQPDGSAELSVYPWSFSNRYAMEMYIEGLGENGFGIFDNEKAKDGTEIRTRIF